MWRYPTHLQVIIATARDGGLEEHRAKQKWPRETQSVTYEPQLSALSYLHCRSASTVIPLLMNATFTPSIQPNLCLPRTRQNNNNNNNIRMIIIIILWV